MKSFSVFIEEVKKSTGGLKDACWSGYTAVGMKTKGGRKVPNCVPEEVGYDVEELFDDIEDLFSQIAEANGIDPEIGRAHV